MKIAKILICLGLLLAIICTSVAMARASEAPSTEEMPSQPQEYPDGTDQKAEETDTVPPQIGSTVVSKTYSEGRRFRSNGDGTCAVAGVGSCTDACIIIPPQSPAGDTVTEILPFAFRDSVLGAMEIPSTVTTLSAASFSGCTELSYIRVAAGSTALKEHNGVLYSADGSTLIYCPARRSVGELKLSPSLRRITAGAFAECTTLTTVLFVGTTSEWHSIIVGDDNEPLYSAGFRFSAAA